MAIVWQVGKIIGLVLLGILGVVLALLLLVLFVPYRYRIEAKKQEALTARARVSWLLRLVAAELVYDKGINLRLKLLGIPLYDKRRWEERAKRRREKRERAGKTDAAEADTAEEGSAAEHTEPENVAKESAATENAATESAAKESSATKSRTKKSAASRKKEPKRVKRKRAKKPPFLTWCEEQLERLCDAAERFFEQSEDGVWLLGDKIDDAIGTYHYYERLIESEGTAWVLRYVKKHLLGILRQLRPSRLDADIDYRSTDPVQLAKVMQYYALSIPLTDGLRGRVYVTALPEEDRLEGTARLKGRVFLGVIAVHGLCLVLNRKLRRFWKLLKREG